MALLEYRLRLPEPRDIGEERDAHGGHDVEEDPLSAVAHALVVVREADGQEPFDRHRHHHVDGGAEGDAVERVLEPGKRLQEHVRVERGERVAERLQHPEHDVEAVADHEG